jgi:CheY-like chemotaxis protein
MHMNQTAPSWSLAPRYARSGGESGVPRILVVDDRPDVRLAFLYMLEASGYQVAEASNGTEALAVLARESIDVILTDLYMPGMDGLGLLRVIKHSAGRQPRVIAMTGSDHLGQGASLEAARVLGADAVLLKPLTREQLVGTIRELLKEHRRTT